MLKHSSCNLALKILRPITDAQAGNPKSLHWSEIHQNSLEKAKSALSSTVPLTHPSLSAEVSLVTDASASHIGAVLQQSEKTSGWPLAFFSAKLSATQQWYSAFDRELLGVFLALRNFRFELEGRGFHIITDHLPLVSALFWVIRPGPPTNNSNCLIYLLVTFAILQDLPMLWRIICPVHLLLPLVICLLPSPWWLGVRGVGGVSFFSTLTLSNLRQRY